MQVETDHSAALPHELPATIRDAIHVCTALGFCYLWVEKYCIPQNESEETHRQIQNMDAIYSGSALNIIDGSGVDPFAGLPGVSRGRTGLQFVTLGSNQHIVVLPSTEDLEFGAWFSREWTYEEALFSNRQLIFTEEQVYLSCNQGLKMELLDVGDFDNPPDIGEISHMQSTVSQMLSFSEQQFENDSWTIHNCISNYSSRTLTFPSDVLDAMSGIFRVMEKRSNLRHLYGIPFMLDKPCALTYNEGTPPSFLDGLRWFKAFPAKRRQGFPSWSWAG